LFRKGKVLWRQSGAMNAQQLSAIVKSKNGKWLISYEPALATDY
jgi:hypothetical protein